LRTICTAYKDLQIKNINKWSETETRIDRNDNTYQVHPIEENELILISLVGIRDILKEGVKEAVIQCQLAGINVIMVTGDNKDTAFAIARSCNIASDPEEAIMGDDLMRKIGGVVCQNCFPFVEYKNILDDLKMRKEKKEMKDIMKQLNYKCECYRTKDEGLLKIKQRLKSEDIKSDPTRVKALLSDKDKKEEYICELEIRAQRSLRN
jgi:hypothetical protein